MSDLLVSAHSSCARDLRTEIRGFLFKPSRVECAFGFQEESGHHHT